MEPEASFLLLGMTFPLPDKLIKEFASSVKKNLDLLEIWVEVNEKFFSDKIKQLEALTKKIAHEIYSVIGISTRVKLVEPKTIERSMGKAKRVTDHRKL